MLPAFAVTIPTSATVDQWRRTQHQTQKRPRTAAAVRTTLVGLTDYTVTSQQAGTATAVRAEAHRSIMHDDLAAQIEVIADLLTRPLVGYIMVKPHTSPDFFEGIGRVIAHWGNVAVAQVCCDAAAREYTMRRLGASGLLLDRAVYHSPIVAAHNAASLRATE